MQFTPKTEDEVKSNRFSLLPDGDYPFTVLESNEQPSKSAKNAGRIMCALKLAVHRPDGGDQWVYDYFADWFSEWKLKHFAETTGHGADYEAGSLDVANNAAQGWQGMVRIVVEVDKQSGKERNAVDDYIVEQRPAALKPEKAKAGFAQVKQAVAGVNDDVPF
jgi:hypothetical protein